MAGSHVQRGTMSSAHRTDYAANNDADVASGDSVSLLELTPLGIVQYVLEFAFDTTWELLTPASIAQALGALAAMLALIISSVHITRHWMYNKTKLRKATVRLLFVVPIFAGDAWACLMLEANKYQVAALVTCVREVYEAIALVSFLELVLTLLGGTEQLAQGMLDKQPTGVIEHVWPLCHILSPYKPGPQFLRCMLLGILQYFAVTIGFFFCIFFIWILQFTGVPEEVRHALQCVPNGLKALSCAWALNCLLLFAREVKKDVPKELGLVLKFLSIKGIVFFTFWQGIAIFWLQYVGWIQVFEKWTAEKATAYNLSSHWWSGTQLKSGLNDFLLCFEVLFFSVLHLYAYPAKEQRNMTHTLRARMIDNAPIARFVSVVNLMNVANIHDEVAKLSVVGQDTGCDVVSVTDALFARFKMRHDRPPREGANPSVAPTA